MALSNAELIEALEQKPLIDIVELVKEMEKTITTTSMRRRKVNVRIHFATTASSDI